MKIQYNALDSDLFVNLAINFYNLILILLNFHI